MTDKDFVDEIIQKVIRAFPQPSRGFANGFPNPLHPNTRFRYTGHACFD